jgi:16S rRNA (cytidine1402-2'-O)-methyltransferase
MLYVCATPIGNLGDVTLRVVDALRQVELIAAEDTRRTRKLLSHFDIHTPLTSFYAHNEAQKTGYVLEKLRAGAEVALVTDAGLPGISDPGARLVSAVLADGLPLSVLPGPSAPATALVASGLAGEAGFRFVGYLPRRPKDLRAALGGWQRCGGVVVAFETPQRLSRSLAELAALLPDAPAAVCRELTKLHEEVAHGPVAELAARFTPAEAPIRGEITLVLDLGDPDERTAAPDAASAAAGLLAKGLSRRDAAAALVICLGLSHRQADDAVRAASEP